MKAGDKVRYSDVNLRHEGKIVSVEENEKFCLVRWAGCDFNSREWIPNLKATK